MRDENIDELREGLALLVCHIKTRAVGVREDGTEITVGARVFADLDDDLYEAMNWCVLNQVKFTCDPNEAHDHVLLVLTEGWRQSRDCTRQVRVAQQRNTPIYGLSPRTCKIVKHR